MAEIKKLLDGFKIFKATVFSKQKDVIKHFQEKAAEYQKCYKDCGYVDIPKGDETVVDLEDEVVL
jgi:hypothetical protein